VDDTHLEIDEAWAQELQRRWESLEAGTAVLHDGPEVMAEMKRRCSVGPE